MQIKANKLPLKQALRGQVALFCGVVEASLAQLHAVQSVTMTANLGSVRYW